MEVQEQPIVKSPLEKPHHMEVAAQNAIQPKRKHDQPPVSSTSQTQAAATSTKPKTKATSKDPADPGKKKPKKAKKESKNTEPATVKPVMPDIIKSTQLQQNQTQTSSLMTCEEKMSESIQCNQLIPKNVLTEIIAQNQNLPKSVIVEIPMVKAAIEYNIKHEEPKPSEMTPDQLARIPTPFRKFYEMKSKGAYERTDEPSEKPAYWNNKPKDDGVNPFLELSKLKSDVKKHKEEQKAQQSALIQEDSNVEESDDLWYKDESDDFQQQLKEFTEENPRYCMFLLDSLGTCCSNRYDIHPMRGHIM